MLCQSALVNIKKYAFQLVKAVLILCAFRSQAFAQNSTSLSTNQSQIPIEKKSLLSNIDLSITNRFYFTPASVNNLLANELGLRYGLSKQLSLSMSLEYDQMTSVKNAANSDLQDADLSITYVYSPPANEQSSSSWDAGLSLIASIPTSRSSQSQSEYGGAGLKSFIDFIVNPFVFTISSRNYEYFYESAYIPAADTVALTKNEPMSDPQAIPPTFLTSALTPTSPQYVANCNFYSDSSIIGLIKMTPNFMFRNEVRYEATGYYDNHFTNNIHDKYGFGYRFAPEFVIWLSQDNSKNTDLSGSIFDSKFMSTILSLYWKI